MIVFLIGAVCMLIAAYVLILPAVFKQGRAQSESANRVQSIDQDAVNLALGKERLTELLAERDAGALDQSTFIRLRDELERSLLQTVDLDKESSALQTRPNRVAIVLLIVLIPVIAFGTYLQTGSGLALNDAARASYIAEQQATEAPDIQAMVTQLSERLKSFPEDGEGWWMLGRTYLVLGNLEQAKAAFANAMPFQDANADLMADYADTLGRLNNSDLTGEAKPLILRALKLDPHQQKAIWLGGVLAFQEGRYSEVEAMMTPLLTMTEENSEIQTSVQRLIDEAAMRTQADQMKAELDSSSAQKPAANPNAFINVTVVLSEELKQSIKGDEDLFVFARASNGPPMPLAASKLKVADLPVSVRLDDSMAMRPGMGISSQASVTVLARISQSGNPIAATGDLQGMQEGVKTASGEDVTITINEAIP